MVNRAAALALRTDTVGSQGESRCGAIHEINMAATEA
jgi:hypothetical protein